MAVPSLQTLKNLGAIRVAYLMWTRHDLFIQSSKENICVDLLNFVLLDTQRLPLSKTMISLILKHIKPAGKNLLSFVNLWFSRTQYDDSEKWLREDMLFECLVLDGYGMINYRKTAEKLLSSRVLHNVTAFRLACCNFLEKPVLKLWPSVRKYFLNKIMLDSELPCAKKSDYYKSNLRLDEPDTLHVLSFIACYDFKSTTEPDEVLFWVSYCVSKENGISLNDIPHFKGKGVTFHDHFIRYSASSGNVSCFDYLYSLRCERCKSCSAEVLKDEVLNQPCFILNFIRLNYEEKTQLFREAPKKMVSHFLQWPLSLTFVEKTEELWNLIPDEYKKWIFLKIFAILFSRTETMRPFFFKFMDLGLIGDIGIYRFDHLESIWITLWKISLDSYKSTVIKCFVYPSILNSDTRSIYRRKKRKLIHLFLTHEKAILELYAETDMDKSLQGLIAKYKPEGLGEGDRRYIPVSLDYLESLHPAPNWGQIPSVKARSVNEKFFDYIKTFMFSSHIIDKSLFHE